MKIGTKLAICFVALAVLPLSAASFMYLRGTEQFGKDMAERGKVMLTDRLTLDLRRATELGAVTIEEARDVIAGEAKFLAGDVASHLALDAAAKPAAADAEDFILQTGVGTAPSQPIPIDLHRMSVHIPPDAARDQVADTLKRLAGLNEVVRTIYLRNRTAIDTLSVTLESGLTVSFPGGAKTIASDQREKNWYLSSLETGETTWFSPEDRASGRILVAAPIQLSDGRRVGAVSISMRLEALLMQSMDVTRLPPEASAYLISVPYDAPLLIPEEVAAYDPKSARWQVLDKPQAFSQNGNDAWLKVVSDIRTGVPGLEYVERKGTREVWSFGPIGSTAEAGYHIAVVFPAGVIDAAQVRAEEIVQESYKAQLRKAIIFALIAGLVAAVLALFGARTLTRPIRRLHEAASKLAGGDFSARVETISSDEIGDLAKDFNRMVPALEEQLRVKRDLIAAKEIQQHLVPKMSPQIDGFDIAGSTLYCDEIGGDYLDYIPLENEKYALVLGDVTGHGVGAALLMTTSRAVLRANAPHQKTAGKVLAAANRQLIADSSGGRSLTLFFMQLTPGSRKINWISAGHEPALIYDPGRDSFTSLDGVDIPLGVDGDWAFNSKIEKLPENGLLLAFTDGIREALNADGQQYGLDKLKDVVRLHHQQGSRAVVDCILNDVRTFRGAVPARDDVSILVVRPT